MLIRVTKEHIEAGERKNCRHCPVALAIQTTIGQMCMVNEDDVIIDGEITQLPLEASNFVGNFDLGEPVVPFVFELDYAGK